MCFVGLLVIEHYLGRYFHQHFAVYFNQSQDTLASPGRLSTPCLMITTLFSPFLLWPIFLNVKTVTWACAFSVFIVRFLTYLVAIITLVPLAFLSMTFSCIFWHSSWRWITGRMVHSIMLKFYRIASRQIIISIFPRMQELLLSTRQILPPRWLSIYLKMRSKSTVKCTS